MLVLVHEMATLVAVVVPTVMAPGVGIAVSVTDCHAVHADGRRPVCVVRARTCTCVPLPCTAVRLTAPVGTPPGRYRWKIPLDVGVAPVPHSTSTPSTPPLLMVAAFVIVNWATLYGFAVLAAMLMVAAGLTGCALMPLSKSRSAGPVGVSVRRITCMMRAPTVDSPMR